MSTFAQKLCNEIVEPALNPSGANIEIASSRFMPRNQSRTNGKTTRTMVVEKKKVVSKLTPHKSNSSKTAVSKLRSKETFLRKVLVDISTNTLITGSLKCDNNCNTMVRKRDCSSDQFSCQCSENKRCHNSSTKYIQTIDNIKNKFLMDKACARYVEMVSCGTQFLNKVSGTFKVRDNSQAMVKARKDLNSSDIIRYSMRQETYRNDYKHRSLEFYLPGKRWALSQYPIRGPDF